MATILITGGTGLIGKSLSQSLLAGGHSVIILTRSTDEQKIQSPGLRYATWDIKAQTIDRDAFSSADMVVHLAGASVAEKRWTKKRKQEIIDSRVLSDQLLVRSIQEIPNKITALVSASAIGWYGADPVIPNPKPFREEDPAAEDFLGSTCMQWEKTLQPAKHAGRRLVILRTGIVLSKEGGALASFRKPLKAGIATILGSGKQVISWVHLEDLVRLYTTAINDQAWNGVYNAVAPMPVSNKQLVLELAKVNRGKFYISMHVPSFVLRIVLGEMSVEVLKSATVSCSKVHIAGFTFLYPSIEVALKELDGKK